MRNVGGQTLTLPHRTQTETGCLCYDNCFSLSRNYARQWHFCDYKAMALFWKFYIFGHNMWFEMSSFTFKIFAFTFLHFESNGPVLSSVY